MHWLRYQLFLVLLRISFPCGTLGPVVKILVLLLWESESQHLRRENLPA